MSEDIPDDLYFNADETSAEINDPTKVLIPPNESSNMRQSIDPNPVFTRLELVSTRFHSFSTSSKFRSLGSDLSTDLLLLL